MALGANRDGQLKALIHAGTAAMTNHAYCPEQFRTFPARLLYSAETFLIWQKIAEMNVVANTFMRAPGESVGTFALENAMGELATALDMDPVELRVKKLEPRRIPLTVSPSPAEISSKPIGVAPSSSVGPEQSATPCDS